MKLRQFSPTAFFLSAIMTLSGCQVARIHAAPGKVSQHQIPFERNDPQARLRILVLGDSTGVGTGARSNTESVAGWFGQDFPQAHIRNLSVNGERLSGMLETFPAENAHYDLVLLQIGANDIIHLTKFKKIEREIATAVDRAKLIGDHVVIMHSGDVGLAPIFSWPLNHLYTDRTKVVRKIYMKTAKEKGVIYVDLFKERKDDLFLTDIDKYYAADHFHPSGQGYRFWYEEIRKTLKDNGVELKG
jgi:lysophospholipase L1-like esterase